VSAEETIREALRDHVGDGEGADEAVLASYRDEVKQEALTQAADVIQKWRDDDTAPGSFWTSRDWRDWLRSGAGSDGQA
jgi:hypothetical protein